MNEYVYTVWHPSPRGWVLISTLGWVLQLTVQLSLCCQTTSLYVNWKEKNNMKVKIKKQSCNARLCTIKGNSEVILARQHYYITGRSALIMFPTCKHFILIILSICIWLSYSSQVTFAIEINDNSSIGLCYIITMNLMDSWAGYEMDKVHNHVSTNLWIYFIRAV